MVTAVFQNEEWLILDNLTNLLVPAERYVK
jgi:hypothetical protein